MCSAYLRMSASKTQAFAGIRGFVPIPACKSSRADVSYKQKGFDPLPRHGRSP